MSVSVKYKGTEIASMNETGTKTLLTSGKYCDANIVVENTKDGGGEPSAPVSPSDITFYDYDGTVVAAWTLAELASKTALPDYPTHTGLICQGWNWTLADLKTQNTKMNVGAMYITDDGKTRIYIRLEEGRTSPMLGCCPNGTVTINWGDGTTPDTLTGTSTSTVKWTSNHNYAAPGDYVITLTATGSVYLYGATTTNEQSGLLRYSSSGDLRNAMYRNSIKKIEIGNNVENIGNAAFSRCESLSSVAIPAEVSLGECAFSNCYSLTFVTIPTGTTRIGSVFGGKVFSYCHSLASIAIPKSVTSVGQNIFSSCESLTSITMPSGMGSIVRYMFHNCYSLASIIIPNSVTSIETYAFGSCNGVAFYDFTSHTKVPTLAATSVFDGISADCQIRVPAALVDEWKAATNWSTYASYIVGV